MLSYLNYPAKVLSYLNYPIEKSFHFGQPSDPPMQRIIRRSQAVFNLVTLLEPQMHEWEFDYYHAKLLGCLRLRNHMTPVFESAFNNMGFHLSKASSVTLGYDHILTLGDAVLQLRPVVLHSLILNDEELQRAPIFRSQLFAMHLRQPEILQGLRLSDEYAHEVDVK